MRQLEEMLEMLDSGKTQELREFIVKEIAEKVAKQNPTEHRRLIAFNRLERRVFQKYACIPPFEFDFHLLENRHTFVSAIFFIKLDEKIKNVETNTDVNNPNFDFTLKRLDRLEKNAKENATVTEYTDEKVKQLIAELKAEKKDSFLLCSKTKTHVDRYYLEQLLIILKANCGETKTKMYTKENENVVIETKYGMALLCRLTV